jgi:hypothetical protein
MGTGSFPGVERPGRGVDHPPTSSGDVKERVELYLYFPSGPPWPVLGRPLPLPLLASGKRPPGEDKRTVSISGNALRNIGVVCADVQSVVPAVRHISQHM